MTSKFTKTEREAVLAEVARLDRLGWNQFEIATAVKVTQPQVCHYLRKIRQRHQDSQLEERGALVREKLEQYRDVMLEAWAAWERSRRDARRLTRKEAHGRGRDEDEG